MNGMECFALGLWGVGEHVQVKEREHMEWLDGLAGMELFNLLWKMDMTMISSKWSQGHLVERPVGIGVKGKILVHDPVSPAHVCLHTHLHQVPTASELPLE